MNAITFCFIIKLFIYKYYGGIRMKQNNSLNVRRLVGAILLALFAIGILGYSQSLLGIAWVGKVRQF